MTDKTISVALRPRLLLSIGEPLLALHPVPRSRTVATIIHAHALGIHFPRLAEQLPVLERLSWQLNFEQQAAKQAGGHSPTVARIVKTIHALYLP